LRPFWWRIRSDCLALASISTEAALSLRAELLSHAQQVAARGALPRISRVYIPEPRPDPGRDAEFGLIQLEEGSCGLYYAWLGASQTGMSERFNLREIVNQDPLAVADYYLADDEAARSIGLAAINAITACEWRRTHFTPRLAVNSFGIELEPGDHLGMVGNFPSLVRQAQARGARVTVLERKAHMISRDSHCEITLDASALRDCRKVIVTAATLINDSLDEVLLHLRDDAYVVVIGPTAGCFPQPLFSRGIKAFGGIRVLDPDLAYARLRAGQRIGDAAERFLLTPNDLDN
jgi:uncharacterized protein (DUF4213/DUF364 family)